MNFFSRSQFETVVQGLTRAFTLFKNPSVSFRWRCNASPYIVGRDRGVTESGRAFISGSNSSDFAFRI